MGYNKIIVVGNLGQDPILRHTGNGKAVCNLSICANERFGTDDRGKAIEAKEWFRVVAWGAMGEAVNKNFYKGRPILIEGRVKSRTYETTVKAEVELNGQTFEVNVPITKEVSEIIATRFEFIDEGSKWNNGNTGNTRKATVSLKSKEGEAVHTGEPDIVDTAMENDNTPPPPQDDEIPF